MGIIRCCDINTSLSKKLLYIIIRPIAVDKEVPNHDHPNGKRKSGVLGKELSRRMREMAGLLKEICHEWFNKVQGGDTEGNASCIDQKEHAQLMDEMTRARIRIRPVTVQGEVADHRTNKGKGPCIDQFHVK